MNYPIESLPRLYGKLHYLHFTVEGTGAERGSHWLKAIWTEGHGAGFWKSIISSPKSEVHPLCNTAFDTTMMRKDECAKGRLDDLGPRGDLVMSRLMGPCERANFAWSAVGSVLGCQKSWVKNDNKNINVFGVMVFSSCRNWWGASRPGESYLGNRNGTK